VAGCRDWEVAGGELFLNIWIDDQTISVRARLC
jgi:hypothetical protein